MSSNTKEKIIWEALELFSRQGYKAVSMRDIAKAVGIRESSIYNHFPGKRGIFDAIVDICWQKAEEYYHSRGLPFSGTEDLSVFRGQESELEETVLEIFRFFFEDPWNVRFRRLLTVGQFEDAKTGELYNKLYCQYPLNVQTSIFQSLVQEGILLGDPETLALEMYGGVFLLLNLCGSWQEARPRLLRHIRQFTEAHRALHPNEKENGTK